jgi:hypothetical protein
MKTLFWYMAAGRVLGAGLGALDGILFINWLVLALGQAGTSARQAAVMIGGFCVVTLFTQKTVIFMAARKPYCLLFLNSVTWILDAVVILAYGNQYPWIVVIFGAIGVMCDQSYIQSRKVLLNRAMHGDDLSLFSNKLDMVGMLAAIAGTTAAVLFEPTLVNIAIITFITIALLTPVNIGQIYCLVKMAEKK